MKRWWRWWRWRGRIYSPGGHIYRLHNALGAQFRGQSIVNVPQLFAVLQPVQLLVRVEFDCCLIFSLNLDSDLGAWTCERRQQGKLLAEPFHRRGLVQWLQRPSECGT